MNKQPTIAINLRDLVRAQAALEILALDNQHSDVDAIRLRGGMRSLSAARLQRIIDRIKGEGGDNIEHGFRLTVTMHGNGGSE
tara:strand:- start:396 stop:644 length:249 start_codon:yes stop_codon:yes gene_type:complete